MKPNLYERLDFKSVPVINTEERLYSWNDLNSSRFTSLELPFSFDMPINIPLEYLIINT